MTFATLRWIRGIIIYCLPELHVRVSGDRRAAEEEGNYCTGPEFNFYYKQREVIRFFAGSRARKNRLAERGR